MSLPARPRLASVAHTGAVGLSMLLVSGCGSAQPPADRGARNPRAAPIALNATLAPVVEGPCSQLRVFGHGSERWLVYGDTGYELQGFLPGDRLGARQTIAQVAGQRFERRARWLRGLAKNDEGYVPAELQLGGDPAHSWLMQIHAEYAPWGGGALFTRHAEGFRFEGRRWRKSALGAAIQRPTGLRQLTALSEAEMCAPPLRFVPLASGSSVRGDLWVGGRCDDDKAPNVAGILMVAHATPKASAWQVSRLPETQFLDANVDMSFATDRFEHTYVAAYEPFVPVDKRHGYVARYRDGKWQMVDAPEADGVLDVGATSDGSVWLAAGPRLLRRDPGGRFEAIKLPPPRWVKPAPPLHFEAVASFGEEVWVRASYRLKSNKKNQGGAASDQASVLFTNRRFQHSYHCDATLPAAEALAIATPE